MRGVCLGEKGECLDVCFISSPITMLCVFSCSKSLNIVRGVVKYLQWKISCGTAGIIRFRMDVVAYL